MDTHFLVENMLNKFKLLVHIIKKKCGVLRVRTEDRGSGRQRSAKWANAEKALQSKCFSS